jgi:hypothetical protein
VHWNIEYPRAFNPIWKGRPTQETRLASRTPGPDYRMHIVAQVDGSEEESREKRVCVRPGMCPLCGGVDCLIGHGYYVRKPKGMDGRGVVWIKRWLCRLCRRTLSVLPDFLFAFRHYVVRVIQAVIEERIGCGKSWARVERVCARGGAPARRTMQRWCVSFALQASRWLGAVQATLAQQDSGSVWLDPQGEALKAGNEAQALLGASEHLLAWGKTRWGEVGEYGRNDRLRFLWLWSSGRGLGRLV